MIALRSPGTARLSHHRQHFFARQETEHRTLEALHRHAQRSLDDVQRRHVAPRRELEERTQRCQPQIAAAHRVVPLLLQVVQERQDQIGFDVGQAQCRGRLAQTLLGEVQEQHQGVAIGSDGAWAQGTLHDQIRGEELLDQGCERRGS